MDQERKSVIKQRTQNGRPTGRPFWYTFAMQTKQNLELKHYCDDFTAMRKVLTELGAEKEVVKKQKDYFFDLPQSKKKVNGRMKVRIESGEMSIIYYERPNFAAGKETSSDIELAKIGKSEFEFLKRLLGVIAVVEKKRELWRKEHTVFHLDTVVGVGNIFEIELQKYGNVNANDRALFSRYQEKVSSLLGKAIKGSNVDLVLKKSK